MSNPMNVVAMRTAPSEPPKKQLGLTMSFTIQCPDTLNDKFIASQQLHRLAEQVSKLVESNYPNLTHTLTSHQEYNP